MRFRPVLAPVTSMRRVLILILAGLAAGCLLFLWPQAPAAADAPGQVRAGEPEAAAELRAGAAESGPQASVDRRQVQAEGPTGTLLRGRCVAAGSGGPIAGCKVYVFGSWRDSQAKQEWLRHNPAPDWQRPEAGLSDADGRFAVRISTPPSAFEIGVALRHPDWVDMHVRWQPLPERDEIDLGSIGFERGVEVLGSLVDQHGKPVAKTSVNLRAEGQEVPDGTPRRGHLFSGQCRQGQFRANQRMPAGDYRVSIGLRGELTPTRLKLRRTETLRQLELRVVLPAPRPQIRGRVLDDAGKPVEGATVRGDFQVGRRRTYGYTDHKGRFKLERRADEPDAAVRLRASKTGYDPRPQSEPVVWGSTDVTLRIQRGAALALRVVQGTERRALEYYAVAWHPVPEGRESVSQEAGELRHEGEHADGRLRIPSLPARRIRLVVVDPRAEPARWFATEVDMRAGQDRELELRIDGAQTRRVRVQTAAGDPVAGVPLELLQAFNTFPLSQKSRKLPPFNIRVGGPYDVGIAHDEARTDARGEASLRGNPELVYSLRLPGPGHIPQLEHGIRIAADLEPLVVVVPQGATIRGRVHPVAALDAFRLPVADRPKHPGFAPGLNLYVPINRRLPAKTSHQAPDRFLLAADGSFAIHGVPLGSAVLHLCYNSGTGLNHRLHLPLMRLEDLREGETRELVIDLRPFRPTKVLGRVHINGEPARGLQISAGASDRKGPELSYERSIFRVGAQADDEGRFQIVAPPLTMRVDARVKDPGAYHNYVLAAGLRPTPGADTALVVDIQTGDLQLRLLSADGIRRIAGVRITARRLDVSFAQLAYLRNTDKEGRASASALQCGRYALLIHPKKLADPTAQAALRRQGITPKQIQIGEVQIQPRQEARLEIKLPAAAGY